MIVYLALVEIIKENDVIDLPFETLIESNQCNKHWYPTSVDKYDMLLKLMIILKTVHVCK